MSHVSESQNKGDDETQPQNPQQKLMTNKTFYATKII